MVFYKGEIQVVRKKGDYTLTLPPTGYPILWFPWGASEAQSQENDQFSYEPNPEISNLTTLSETRQPDFGAKSIYFAI